MATPAPAAKTARRPVASKPATVKEPAPPPAPKLSKGELRQQIEKLEQAIAKLRTKGRESNKLAKASAKRITELEEQVTQFEHEAARRAPAPKATKPKAPKPQATQPQATQPEATQPKAARPKAARAPRKSRSIDPGDAVPPGVAVEDPAPMDKEAKAAFENLEQNLKG